MTLDGDKKKKCIIAGLSRHPKTHPTKTRSGKNTKAVKTVCAPTDYKETCLKSLMDASPKSTEPLALIKLSFNVTIKSIQEGLKKASEDVKHKADKHPEAKDAFELCEKVMNDAIADLKKCVDHKVSVDEIERFIKDLRIKSTLKHDMINIFKRSRQLSSNSLAMVTDLNSNATELTGAFENNARKLLSTEDGVPTWVGPEARRLMGAPGGPPVKANAVVAQDGSGQFKTINDALNAVPKENKVPFVIHIKEGVYKEKVVVTRKMPYVTFIGDGPTKTVISGSLNFGIGKVKTYLTAPLTKGIGMENTAGPEGGQAVALRVSGDYAVFFDCQIDGYKTPYTFTLNVNSTVTALSPAPWTSSSATRNASSKTANRRAQTYGRPVVYGHRSGTQRRPGRSGVYSVRTASKAYLGRPWKEFSRTIVIKTTVDDVIDPAGWLPWSGDFALKTLYYAEHLNVGPGANQAQRVKWPGIKKLTHEQALSYTCDRFLSGNTWIPRTQVPYTAGM
ncbi:hypothetical protein HID58_096005 [Brassica napus]|uniref:Pectinesterase n=1 Tax=Brassica napus TaxID=3708 RepID=A0ABQ7X1T4_BRANA|nr:hypothetical protein HID58_096005 [Brassica napus]